MSNRDKERLEAYVTYLTARILTVPVKPVPRELENDYMRILLDGSSPSTELVDLVVLGLMVGDYSAGLPTPELIDKYIKDIGVALNSDDPYPDLDVDERKRDLLQHVLDGGPGLLETIAYLRYHNVDAAVPFHTDITRKNRTR